MKTSVPSVAFLCVLAAASASAQPASSATAGERPPVVTAPAVRPAEPVLGDQRVYIGGNEAIIPAEQARAVVDKFKEAYARLGSPRLLFYVNRELVDTTAGLKLSKRTERTEAARSETRSDVEAPAPAGAPQTQVNVSVGGSAGASAAVVGGKGSTQTSTEKVSGENTYEARAGAETTLADRQTVRDVERLFGRPFRVAGAALADQRAATALIADKEISHFTAGANDQARKDREALAQVADVVVEVLISSRQAAVTRVSGDTTAAVPDIQATAIRLRDAAIIGQASSRDVLGKDREAGRIVARFDASDIAEATALALMEDMTLGAK
ncbi:MAG: hypothetical protein JNG83_04990 [Opitutaceae bacterium]|nr:hypothetical protein [Opitutaceae bacterium]